MVHREIRRVADGVSHTGERRWHQKRPVTPGRRNSLMACALRAYAGAREASRRFSGCVGGLAALLLLVRKQNTLRKISGVPHKTPNQSLEPTAGPDRKSGVE